MAKKKCKCSFRSSKSWQKNMVFLDISEKFLNEDGTQNLALYADTGCHPNNAGYQVWADALLPCFQEAGLTVE